MRIIGKILDERFTQLLITRTDLDLVDVIMLDKVQKNQPISEAAYKSLKRAKLIEGRRSPPFISATVAIATEREAEYVRNRGIEKEDCKQKVVDYLKLFGSAALNKFLELLSPQLSNTLTDQQKRHFIRNILQEMRREKVIERVRGSATKGAVWELAKPPSEGEV